MVNCCALAAVVARMPAVTMPTRAAPSRPINAYMSFPPWLPRNSGVLTPGEQIPDSDQGNLRYVGDQHQGDEIDYHEWNDAAIDRLELEAEHRLRDEYIDAERRVKQADRQVHRHHDAEVHRVDAGRLHDRHQERAQQQDRGQGIEEAADQQ